MHEPTGSEAADAGRTTLCEPSRPSSRCVRPTARYGISGQTEANVTTAWVPDQPPYHPSDLCDECRPQATRMLKWLREWAAQQLGVRRRPVEEPTTTPEDTLREAGISSRRQAEYQRRMSSLLAGRS